MATMLSSLPSRLRHSDSVRDMDFDIARADMMTPFSLSLAAERAIESAKRQLDAMDERLLRARMSMASARSKVGERRVSESEIDQARRGWSEPVIADGRRSISDSYRVPHSPTETRDDAGDNDIERRTIEMKKLRDDLRDLRSRMNQPRSMADTLKLTPPRPRRPSAAEIPDLKALAKSLEGHNFVLPSLHSPKTVTKPPAVRPTSSSTINDNDNDSPIVVAQQENPFSPRPYSSLSILEPLSPKLYPETLKPYPKSSIPTFHSPSNLRQQQQQEQTRKSYQPVSPREPFADLPHRAAPPQSHRRSSGSDTAEYSDPDTSIGTRTPSATSPARSIGSSANGTFKSSAIPRSKRYSGDMSGSKVKENRLSQDSMLSDNDHQELLDRVEHLLARISMLDTGTEEERRRRRKLQAALAILEDSEEE